MPLRERVDCRCAGEGCDGAAVESIDLTAEVLGYLGDYSKPLGKAVAREVDGAVQIGIEIAGGVSYADDMVALMESGVSPIVRPYPDPVRSASRIEGATRVYERLAVAGWIATFTDQRGGFEAATLAGEGRNRRGTGRVEPPGPLETILRRPAESRKRRVWL